MKVFNKNLRFFYKNKSTTKVFKMTEFAMKQFKGVAELFVNLDITAVSYESRNGTIQRELK